MNGGESNKVFRGSIESARPYYYITAHLNLDGAEVGGYPNNYVYFFNKENNFNYLNPSLYPNGPDSYPGFYPLDEESVIGEITVYSNPDLKYSFNGGDISDFNFFIGGAYIPSVSQSVPFPIDVWAGPTGNTPGPIQGDLIAEGQVCYYGREPQNPEPYGSENRTRKFLALNILQRPIGDPESPQAPVSDKSGKPAKTVLGKIKSVYKSVASRGKSVKQIRQVLAEDALDSGELYVVVKVYPKFQ